jgi:hypothetical protein
MSDDLDPLEQHLVEALGALEGPSPGLEAPSHAVSA